MYSFATVNVIQFDVTMYCNSYCGTCARNNNGGEFKPELKLEHMSMDTWRSVLSPNNVVNLNGLSFNGNYGDAIMHPDLIEMFEYAADLKPEMGIEIHTNGGARTPEFFKQLATVLKRFRKHRVVFGIDGIKGTSDIYRRGVNFDKVMENASAFIAAGGIAAWRYIVFDYNIDQIAQAEKQARDMNFAEFQLNRSVMQSIPMKQYKNFPELTITAPDRERVVELKELYGFKNYPGGNSIQETEQSTMIDSKCPWAQRGNIQVDPSGCVWPCCYFSLDIYYRAEYLDKLRTFNNLNKNSLHDVLEHDYFKIDLPQAWEDRSNERCNKCQWWTTV